MLAVESSSRRQLVGAVCVLAVVENSKAAHEKCHERAVTNLANDC